MLGLRIGSSVRLVLSTLVFLIENRPFFGFIALHGIYFVGVIIFVIISYIGPIVGLFDYSDGRNIAALFGCILFGLFAPLWLRCLDTWLLFGKSSVGATSLKILKRLAGVK